MPQYRVESLISLSIQLSTNTTKYLYVHAENTSLGLDNIHSFCSAHQPWVETVSCVPHLVLQYEGLQKAGTLFWEQSPRQILAHMPVQLPHRTVAVVMYTNETAEETASSFCQELHLEVAATREQCIHHMIDLVMSEVQSWKRDWSSK
jgi:hypothetical protein